MRLVTASQMREADRRAIHDHHIPGITLMENAGRAVAAALDKAFGPLSARRVAIVCGRGNNGGDGFVVARLLSQRNVSCVCVLVGAVKDVSGDAKQALGALRAWSDVREAADEASWRSARHEIVAADLIVDALVGTGLTKPLSGLLAEVVADLNSSHKPIVAIDLPSGMSSEVVDLAGPTICARMTVTLAAPKVSVLLSADAHAVGELIVADIGIPASVIDELPGVRVELVTSVRVRGLITPRRADSNKGDYGRVLIVAGSRGKTGAAGLAARAALRSGAGLVTVATPSSCLPVVAGLGLEFMTVPLDEDEQGRIAHDAAETILNTDADVIAMGPGLGRGGGVTAVVKRVLERATVPVVLDADALNVFEGGGLVARDGQTLVITPHPGEMARLIGRSTADVNAQRLDTAMQAAASMRACVVLKGHHTIVAAPEDRVFVNSTGNPGMATGGTGDVLTGMIAAWLAQLKNAEAACTLAVYLHGLAGDLAAEKIGEVALVAGDLVDSLGGAVLSLSGTPHSHA